VRGVRARAAAGDARDEVFFVVRNVTFGGTADRSIFFAAADGLAGRAG